MKTIAPILFISLSLIICRNAHGQECIQELKKNELYSDSKSLLNGTKWIFEKKYLGSPLLMENYWPKADIVYHGILFEGELMNYDLYSNEIIVFHPEKGREKYVVISRDYLSGFSFTDTVTHKKHRYEYTELPGIPGKALYENASIGKTDFYIKPVKYISISSSNKGKFSGTFEYFIDAGNGYRSFRTKKQFISLLATHGADLKRYIRKNKLKINNEHPEHISTVLAYFNGLS